MNTSHAIFDDEESHKVSLPLLQMEKRCHPAQCLAQLKLIMGTGQLEHLFRTSHRDLQANSVVWLVMSLCSILCHFWM